MNKDNKNECLLPTDRDAVWNSVQDFEVAGVCLPVIRFFYRNGRQALHGYIPESFPQRVEVQLLLAAAAGCAVFCCIGERISIQVHHQSQVAFAGTGDFNLDILGI